MESKLYSDIDGLAQNVKILVISGERRQESAGRAKYNEMEIHRTNATAKAHRLVHQWRSVIDWDEAQIWDIIRRHCIAPHPCYTAGWNRCSCMMCIFSLPSHWAGIRELFPERFAEVEEDERILGFTLDNSKALAEYVGNAKSCVCHDDPRAIHQLTSGEFSADDVEKAEWIMPAGAFHGAEGGHANVWKGSWMNAVVKYPGAKWSLAERIISYIPPHHSYLEPFFGSGAVLFNKPRSHIETVNDLDSAVVNLFRCIREDPERLAREIYFTPYSREIHIASYQDGIPEDPFAYAVKFLVKCNQGYGFRTNEIRVGWKNDIAARERAYAAKCWTELPEIILQAAERLRGVQIECRPALEVIRRFNFPNVLIYADLPYVLSSRSGGKKQYRHEMTDEDHIELLKALKAHQGPVLLSGYASPLYDCFLDGWHKETLHTTDQLSRKRQEVLWMNFQPNGQESLF